MEPSRSQFVKMETKDKGGRPPKNRIKFVLKAIMKELKNADVNLVRKRFTEASGLNSNYHTIKKYLDLLVKEDVLRVQVVQDNLKKIEKGKRKLRRRVYFYTLN